MGAPYGLILERHRDLQGRERRVWYRNALVLLLVGIQVLALLNVFGQRPASSRADSPAASLAISSPKSLRGGLMFESRFTILAHRPLDTPKLVLDPGWFEQMTINSLEPSASSETSRDGKIVLSFDSLRAGQKLVFWAFFQTPPAAILDIDGTLVTGRPEGGPLNA